MATAISKTTRQYKDLDLNFTVHPVTKDINKHKDHLAVINAVKNLILLNHYEKPFHPEIGSNIRALLFENLDNITALSLEREIQQTIRNFEPRVDVKEIKITPDFRENGFSVTITFYIINRTEPVTIDFFLERVR